MKQFKASYLLESVISGLKKLSTDKVEALKIDGLLENISCFDVISSLNLELPEKPDSLLAVANNLVTKGTPTFPSILIEDKISAALGLSEKSVKYGTIHYDLKKEIDYDINESIFESLHLIDPRLKKAAEYVNSGDLDSNFERSFLFNHISQDKSFLCQLFQHQRQRGTLGRDNRNEGRVDFSLEIPYSRIDSRTNRFNKSVDIKNKRRYIVEVDGTKYHSDLLDDIKDFEIARLNNNVHHIREETSFGDANRMISAVLAEDYIKTINKLFDVNIDKRAEILQFVLSPIAVARLQKTIIQFLISNPDISNINELKLLVIERDVPCGEIASQDLNEILSNLAQLSGYEKSLPYINSTVVSNEDFISSPLHFNNQPKFIENLDIKDFDLIIDISVLRRTGVVKDDYTYQSEKSIIIRSSHFEWESTLNPVYIAPLINYQEVTKALTNEEHIILEKTSTALQYFLQMIFRKIEFRDGQLPILNRALQNKPVIGLLPTGAGKSLAYQLASLLQPSITMVVDPIRSLMLDQYNGLKKIGIDRCEFINSTQTSSERRYIQNELLPNGELQFTFVSPERFVIKEFRNTLENAANNGVYFGYCVVDEVHCVSEWGHDFRTPYLNLGTNAIKYCRTYNGEPVTLFGLTATASFDVLADIEIELHIPNDDGNALVRYENTVRDEINYRILKVDGDFKTDKYNQWDVRENIGKAKKDAVIDILNYFKEDISRFNDEMVFQSILRRTYDEYLPTSNRNSTDFETFYSKAKLMLEVTEEDFNGTNDDLSDYKYGSIIFCPHRNGNLGVQYFRGEINESLLEERIGYFMGSSDEENAVKVDQDSFSNLELFVENKQSVMVATKAFGMGIDKPNVRTTIHVNIPQSIESFVQEAGRAGRDKKLSLSYILFNNQQLQVNGEQFNLDEDVLLFFHKNSFKGKIKERQTIFELRTKVSFPNINRIHQINDIINDLFADEGIEFEVTLGNNNWMNFIFVQTTNQDKIGSVNIQTEQIRIIDNINNYQLCNDVLSEIKNQIPFYQLNSVKEIQNWLQTYVIDENHEVGIEKRLADLSVGDTGIIKVPFINKYYSIPRRSQKEFSLNPNHLNFLLADKTIASKPYLSSIIRQKLPNAIYNGNSYSEFIDSLQLTKEDHDVLINSQSTERAFYIPRSQEDTAKGIFRLTSIGVIDTYTIDYQNKLYALHFTKHDEGYYFNRLQELYTRYTSVRQAESLLNTVKQDFYKQIEGNRATEISICLKHLTEFIYSRIEQKRRQAINDMIDLCNVAISEDDPINQSQLVKDHVYYYFNAKYSRLQNDATIKGAKVAASMPNDKGILNTNDTIWKYIDIVEQDESGEFKNNIKHLRGSTMRMLRNSPNEPHYLILKSYSLIILTDNIPQLAAEAKKEMAQGLIEWNSREKDINIVAFLSKIKQRINDHIEIKNIKIIFDDIEDLYYSDYYQKWTKEFSVKFLNNY